jgi:hypothetical protein
MENVADDRAKSAHCELPHHAPILMFQNVAVIHVGMLLSGQMIEANDNFLACTPKTGPC